MPDFIKTSWTHKPLDWVSGVENSVVEYEQLLFLLLQVISKKENYIKKDEGGKLYGEREDIRLNLLKEKENAAQVGWKSKLRANTVCFLFFFNKMRKRWRMYYNVFRKQLSHIKIFTLRMLTAFYFYKLSANSRPLLGAIVAPTRLSWISKKIFFIWNGKKMTYFRGCKQTECPVFHKMCLRKWPRTLNG